MPVFGYPLITYSPKSSALHATDSKVWKHAIVSNGDAVKDIANDEVKMISTKNLKFELTEKMDKEIAKGT